MTSHCCLPIGVIDNEGSRKPRPPVDLLESSDHEYSVHEQGGEPAVEILEFATDPNAETVILGVSGRSPVGKVPFGSLALAVIIDSHRPVTVVPEHTATS